MDAFSSSRESLVFIHDKIIVILTLVLRAVLYLLLRGLLNRFSRRALLENQSMEFA